MKNLTGQRFGRLVAVAPTDRRVGDMVVWRCVCDCGNVVYAASSNLTRGRVRSCGCLAREAKARPRSLAGRRFGSLVAVDADAAGQEWRCVCDCGRVVKRFADDLKAGRATSCGHCDEAAPSQAAPSHSAKRGAARATTHKQERESA